MNKESFDFDFSRKIAEAMVAQTVRHLPAMQETGVRLLGQEDPLEKETAIHSSTLAWKIPWTEEPDRLQSMGSQSPARLSNFTFTFTCMYLGFPGGASGKEPACQCRGHRRCRFNPWDGKMPWRRACQPTQVLPGESPWTEELGGLQFIGLQRVGHD